MHQIERTLPFTTKTQWAWPDNDEKLIAVFYEVLGIDYIMQFVDQTRLCIQAGGGCGIWPLRFAVDFDQVITFEPLPENYECLEVNTWHQLNILCLPHALTNRVGKHGAIKFHDSETSNNGAGYYVEGAGDIPSTTIDEIGATNCDLIQLDIEGLEADALAGATETIKEFKPVIVIEEKPLPQYNYRDHTAARQFLEGMGYKQVGSIKRDVIFKC